MDKSQYIAEIDAAAAAAHTAFHAVARARAAAELADDGAAAIHAAAADIALAIESAATTTDALDKLQRRSATVRSHAKR